MTTVIKLKKNESANNVPTTSDIAVGEVAVNTTDKKIYVRDSSNAIVQVASNDIEEATALAIALG
jgi:hypothetical protein|tara:strand:- start:1401 stop:1595 length:195 start_codon:yes stop_codon:yes gene_type:complete